MSSFRDLCDAVQEFYKSQGILDLIFFQESRNVKGKDIFPKAIIKVETQEEAEEIIREIKSYIMDPNYWVGEDNKKHPYKIKIKVIDFQHNDIFLSMKPAYSVCKMTQKEFNNWYAEHSLVSKNIVRYLTYNNKQFIKDYEEHTSETAQWIRSYISEFGEVSCRYVSGRSYRLTYFNPTANKTEQCNIGDLLIAVCPGRLREGKKSKQRSDSKRGRMIYGKEFLI